MLRLRSSLLGLFVGLLLTGLVAPVSAQSVASVVGEMRSHYEQQTETVDTYIVETNLYTSYNKKVMKDGNPTYRTQTKMKNDQGPSFTSQTFASTSTPSSAYDLQLDRLEQHATYADTETIDGVACHVLQVDDPSKVNPDMKGKDANSMTYYIHGEQYVPVRMVIETKTQGKRRKMGGAPTSVTVNMKNYKTTDGLTLPHRMELEIDLPEKQRKRMQKMIQKMENMPEQQQKQMQNMMGDQMEKMKQMVSDEPMIVEVQSVKVNVDLPEWAF